MQIVQCSLAIPAAKQVKAWIVRRAPHGQWANNLTLKNQSESNILKLTIQIAFRTINYQDYWDWFEGRIWYNSIYINIQHSAWLWHVRMVLIDSIGWDLHDHRWCHLGFITGNSTSCESCATCRNKPGKWIRMNPNEIETGNAQPGHKSALLGVQGNSWCQALTFSGNAGNASQCHLFDLFSLSHLGTQRFIWLQGGGNEIVWQRHMIPCCDWSS